MRNIIFTSIAILSGGVAGHAQEAPLGCFVRDYDADHMAAHPEQTVTALSLSFVQPDAGPAIRWATMTAMTSDAAGAGLAKRRFTNTLVCETHPPHDLDPTWVTDGALRCGVECDGGFFEILPSDEGTLLIRTERVRLTDGAGCGGDFSLHDLSDGPTTYRLNAAAPERCAEAGQ